MADTRDLLHHSHMFIPDDTMKLTSSASEQNVYFTYVCLVSGIKPNEHEEHDSGLTRTLYSENVQDDKLTYEDEPIQVERSKALHELIESHRKSENKADAKEPAETDSSTPYPATTSEDSEVSENDECNFIGCDNPNILKLTKMKWLTENQEGGPDSSTPSLSPATSTVSSNFSKDSDENLSRHDSFGDKYLSTILRLDKEHNMFGLSNIAVVGNKASKLKRREDERAVFHQTAIVQVCCGKKWCRYKSNTDLPASLKCGGCRGCCVDPSCTLCTSVCCGPPVSIVFSCDKENLLCTPHCIACPKGKCICKLPCPPIKCSMDCNKCYGLKVSVNRKPQFDPTPIELTPRSSSVLQKPIAARSCHHLPQCIPPSSCFPYLMPCFWPARSSAPCSVPARCFHNPPCLAPRKHRCPLSPEASCPRTGICEDPNKKTKCTNDSCLGVKKKSLLSKDFPDSMMDRKKKKKIKIITCECAVPTCASCFVSRPEKKTPGEGPAD